MEERRKLEQLSKDTSRAKAAGIRERARERTREPGPRAERGRTDRSAADDLRLVAARRRHLQRDRGKKQDALTPRQAGRQAG